jgi:hypothetical protein
MSAAAPVGPEMWRADANPERAVSEGVPQILYIMGTGRTGTTILEILLANNPGMVGVGEAKHIFRDGFIRNLPCACGRAGLECELWSRVLEMSGWNLRECEDRGRLVEHVESHARFPFVWLGAARARSLERYRRTHETLFRAVGAITHAQVIVDSSKYAGRALLFARLFPDRVKVLCITRSAAGMLKAFQKVNDGEQRPKGRLAVAAYYLYVLACMRVVRRRLGERCFEITFEELNSDPAVVLARIERWSGWSLVCAREKVASGGLLSVGHIVTGNRLRRKGAVRFEPSAAMIGRQSVGERRLAAALERCRRWLGFSGARRS